MWLAVWQQHPKTQHPAITLFYFCNVVVAIVSTEKEHAATAPDGLSAHELAAFFWAPKLNIEPIHALTVGWVFVLGDVGTLRIPEQVNVAKAFNEKEGKNQVASVVCVFAPAPQSQG